MNENLYYYHSPQEREAQTIDVDICIYGGNAAGVIAAVQAARDGHSVAVVEPGGHLGGLTAGGLSATDIGNKDAIGGLSRELYRAFGKHYGVEEEWHFEPSVAEETLKAWVAQNGIPVYFRHFLDTVALDGKKIVSITTESGLTVQARIFIDCSYEGDLMAKSGVSYHVGRESNDVYGETLNGVQHRDAHQFQHPVDPYVVPGDPSSGLLPGIDPVGPIPNGTGDHRVQAYNFRLCLTKRPDNLIPWEKPGGYDPRDYELLARYYAIDHSEVYGMYDAIRGDKVDKNNHGAVSTDFIGGNWLYPDAGYAARETIFQAHVRWQKGLFWFLATDERVPAEARKWVNSWGLAKDEFVETGGWPHQLYIREARRMVSDYVSTDADCRHLRRPDDSVGLAAYNMDSHNCRRFAIDGRVRNEGDVQVAPTGPYPISYRSIVPRATECANLLVPVCMAASHIAYGSIRMEPVFIILGQSAAVAASVALADGVDAVQSISYARLRSRLEQAGQVLDWPAAK
ncbi:MAG: FAD-dependent oxidoreductase [Capsulimonadaceae bacterium]|nr:FAD-dependent oxidoreductase [Capsulimonadaceae bacterium]